jgi:hypothetical protein
MSSSDLPSQTVEDELESNYRGLVKKGSVPRNNALETGLGFKAP